MNKHRKNPNKTKRINTESFYATVVSSPQWKLWYEEQMKRMNGGRIVKKKFYGKGGQVWDIDESQECDLISQNHFQDFIKFIKFLKPTKK